MQPCHNHRNWAPMHPVAIDVWMAAVLCRHPHIYSQTYPHRNYVSKDQYGRCNCITAILFSSGKYVYFDHTPALFLKKETVAQIHIYTTRQPNDHNHSLTLSLSLSLSFSASLPGLKSIMKKNGATAKRSSGGAKKNLKFVGVNGG